MKKIGSVKRGDSFSFTVDLVNTNDGSPLSGIASNLKCQGRYTMDGPVLIEFAISETEVPGTYLFDAGSTEDWVPGRIIVFDIQYTSEEGDIVSSENIGFLVEGDVTR